MSINYLKDLVETTHAFLKLMEAMSKVQPLVIKSKKTRKVAPKKNAGHLSVNNGASMIQEKTEKVWDFNPSGQSPKCISSQTS